MGDSCKWRKSYRGKEEKERSVMNDRDQGRDRSERTKIGGKEERKRQSVLVDLLFLQFIRCNGCIHGRPRAEISLIQLCTFARQIPLIMGWRRTLWQSLIAGQINLHATEINTYYSAAKFKAEG
jgi:hypothetical protein